MKLQQIHRDQPKATKHKVWDVDEHQGKTQNRWYTGNPRAASQYKWPKTTFHGQSEGYEEHILD